MIKYFTIEDLLKHYLQKKFHILEDNEIIYFFTSRYCQGTGWIFYAAKYISYFSIGVTIPKFL